MLKAAYQSGITTEMLAYMSLNEVIVRIGWYFDSKRAENLEQWRMVRRLAFIQSRSMGSKLSNEMEMWEIEGDRRFDITLEKVDKWKKWLVKHGKIKGEA